MQRPVGKAVAHVAKSHDSPLRTAYHALRLRDDTGERPSYYAPGSLEEVTPRGGSKAPHFAYVRRGANAAPRAPERYRGGEGVFHALIKAVIAERQHLDLVVAGHEIMVPFRDVVLEERVTSGGVHYWVDVVGTVESPALVAAWCPDGRLGVEVCVTHETEAAKKRALRVEGRTVIELKFGFLLAAIGRSVFGTATDVAGHLLRATDDQVARVRAQIEAHLARRARRAVFIAGGPTPIPPGQVLASPVPARGAPAAAPHDQGHLVLPPPVAAASAPQWIPPAAAPTVRPVGPVHPEPVAPPHPVPLAGPGGLAGPATGRNVAGGPSVRATAGLPPTAVPRAAGGVPGDPTLLGPGGPGARAPERWGSGEPRPPTARWWVRVWRWLVAAVRGGVSE